MVQSIFKSCLLSLLGLIRLVAAFGRFRSATTEISNGFKNSKSGAPLVYDRNQPLLQVSRSVSEQSRPHCLSMQSIGACN